MILLILQYAIPACAILLIVLLLVLHILEYIEAKQLEDFNKNKGGK